MGNYSISSIKLSVNSIQEYYAKDCILEVDLEYPHELRNLHDFPLPLQKIKIKQVCYQIIVLKWQIRKIFQLVESKRFYQN